MDTPEQRNRPDYVLFKNDLGGEVRGNVRRLTPLNVSFEIYSNDDAPAISEAIKECRIFVSGELAYEGRAVIESVVDIGTGIACEARLAEPLDIKRGNSDRRDVSANAADAFQKFLESSQSLFKVSPAFKLVVADMQTFLRDFQRWAEWFTVTHTQHVGPEKRLRIERDVVHHVQDAFQSFFGRMFLKFEEACGGVDKDTEPVLRSYVQQHLHPLVLCAPFLRRTFEKPLGYAGDYEMVNMMVRDPVEGDTLFAKTLNAFFLSTPPVIAHRNRVAYLKDTLARESCRLHGNNRPFRVLNIGCGPAKEIQDFIAEHSLCDRAEFTLIDFSEETLAWTGAVLERTRAQLNRSCSIRLLKKSVIQLLKDGVRSNDVLTPGAFDLVYCAGLFDYLTDSVCAKLTELFYQLAANDGLVLVTNVESMNPSRRWMEYAVDWHLIYRDHHAMEALIPGVASPDDASIRSELSGVNVFLEVRKTSDD